MTTRTTTTTTTSTAAHRTATGIRLGSALRQIQTRRADAVKVATVQARIRRLAANA